MPPAAPFTLSSAAQSADALFAAVSASSAKARGTTASAPAPAITPLASPQTHPGIIAVGPDAGAAPTVKVYNAQTLKLQFSINAYANTFTGGVRVAVADVNGDGSPDIITAPGPGGGSLIKVFSGVDGTLLQSFNAYAPGQTDGVYVAAGDVNADGKADIITGTDTGALPLVKVFSGVNDSLLLSFLSDPLAGANGVRVAAGDVNGDGHADIITGAGPGGAPRVTVVDGVTGKEFVNFFAYEDTFTGGVYVAAGDLDGDGRFDIITGAGSGAPWVHTYRGLDEKPLGNFLAYDSTFTGGVRVAAVDPNGGGLDEIVTGGGPGGREARVFSGQILGQQASFLPCGGSFSAGLFVGASSGNGSGAPVQPFSLPTVTVTVDKPVVVEPASGPGINVIFTATRTGSTSQQLLVGIRLGGTATAGTDFYMGTLPFNFGPGQSTATQTASILDDGIFDNTSVFVVILQPSPYYNIGNPGSAQVEILDTPFSIPDCGCGANEVIQRAAGLNTNPVSPFSAAGVDYFDGVVRSGASDLASGGFGVGWGQDRSWTNALSYDSDGLAGNGGVITQLPYLLEDGHMHVALISNGTTLRIFDVAGAGVHYSDRYGLGDDFYEANGQITITDTLGQVMTFSDDTTVEFGERGIFKSFTDVGGNVTSVTSSSGSLPTEVQHSSTVNGNAIFESYLYTYGTPNGVPVLTNVTLRRGPSTTGPWTTVRQAAYTYDINNNLKLAVVEDAAGTALDTSYSRYYASGDVNGYANALKYAFGPQSYARLVAALGSNVDSLSDAQIAPYADAFYKYDPEHRVTQATIQGAGASGSGGLGTFSYAYTASSFPFGIGNWQTKSVETLPDGNQNISYTNYLGQVLLQVFKDTASGNQWETFYRYDNAYRLIWTASPSAVTGYDETKPDLLYNQNGNYLYLSDTTGLLTITDYGASTTATSSSAGDVAGYYKDTQVQQGENGTAILQSATQYFSQTANGVTVYPTANTAAYRNSGGSGAETTSYTDTWFANTHQMQSMTVTKPVISSSQNGPGPSAPDTETTFFDGYGRPIWFKDGDGFIQYTEYDQATGAVDKTITDVNTSNTGDFMNLPSGWTTPSGGGLHLITRYLLDPLGRTTKLTDPLGNVTYTVYLDANYEVRTYAGWNSATNMPTGPTADYREDRPHSYTETLTMSATPHLTGGVPDGSEAVSGVQTLSRQYISAGGQDIADDKYFNLSGVTYSTAAHIGTLNTNYYETTYGYDSRGRLSTTTLPTNTVETTNYDGLGRTTSTAVGTTTLASTTTANYIYDSNTLGGSTQVGDGNLTQIISHPGGSAADRVTEQYYDWRDRLVATKQGVQSSEDTATHRPITFTAFDNLGEVTEVQQFDGDGVTITSTNGVPNVPSAGLLRAETITSYDDQGRVYKTQTYSVDPSSGSVSTNALTTQSWYDHRGDLIKTSNPGGEVDKAQFDGAGRETVSYVSDGGGDSSWTDATNVTADNVLSQVETTYDKDSNAIMVTDRERNHDETATGALGNPTTTPKARVSYSTAYFDLANRVTATVDVGTNGGSAYTRPGSVPAASDTVLVTLDGYTVAGYLDSTTDPRGLVTKHFYDNLARETKTVEAYDGGAQTATSNKTTEFTYDGSDHMLTLQADETGGAYEKTQWTYGVTTTGGSDVNSNDILANVKYPDPSTGNPSSSFQESYTANALGETKTYTDRAGNVHTYTLDILGRVTSDAITTLATGFDGSVRRIQTAYDTQGNPYLATSYDAVTGGNIVNQVQRAYNGLGQMTQEWQSHSGAVNTGTTPSVQYGYTLMSGGANNSRLTSMTYPNGKVLNYNYGSSGSLADTISRLDSLSDSSGTLEQYSYLGLTTVVKRAHSQPGVDLTYIKQTGESNGDAGDQYTGLDRFGRVVDQRWLNTGRLAATDRFQYGYDRDSNALYRNNLVNTAFGELYHASGAGNGYDNLNQLSGFLRGVLSASGGAGTPLDTVSSPTHSQSWSPDAMGNFSGVTTDGTTQTRTHNQQNEITAISSLTTPTYDSNGNLTKDEQGQTYKYDAWNRLVQVKNSGATVIASYSYDGSGRRIQETHGSTVNDLYYSAAWQVLEERTGGVSTATDQYVWSPVYVDALVLRDRSTQNNGTLDERFWAQQDEHWNVTALVNSSGSVVERYIYDPYGQITYLNASWSTLSGSAYAFVYGFQGLRLDTATGNNYARARDYRPSLGRWTSQDPLGYGAGDSNLYRYAGNNSVNVTDSSGQIEVTTLTKNPETHNGSFQVDWRFILSKPAAEAGNIVQMITWWWHYTTADGKEHRDKEVYWEAWNVVEGQRIEDDQRLFPKYFDYTDRAGGAAFPDRSCGKVTQSGKIKFFFKTTTENLKGFHPGAVKHALALPSTKTQPTWWNRKSDNEEPTGRRRVQTSWPDGDPPIDVTP